MNIYLKPYEFCSIAGTSKRTLLLYDKIGIFKPKKLSRNSGGTRLYTRGQAKEFKLIQVISSTGVPLSEILLSLQRFNFSYLRLYNHYKSRIINQAQSVISVIDDIIAGFEPYKNFLNHFELGFSNKIDGFKYSKEFDINEVFDKLNSLKDIGSVNNAYFIEFKPKVNFWDNETRRFSIGSTSTHLRSQTKEIDEDLLSFQYDIAKCLKRSHLISKINEKSYIESMNLFLRSSSLKPKSIRLILHNREKDHRKYLCETNIIL
jgi:DNA-binding transcriptional MerR regulator